MWTISSQWWYDQTPNFGDMLAPVVTKYALAKALPRAVEWRSRHVLLSIGSIIHVADRFEHAVIWGTGYEPAYGKLKRHDLSIAALRGPITRDLLGVRCAVLGDPALLMPRVYPRRRDDRGDVSVIVHQSNRRRHLPYRMISPLQDWKVVIDELCRSRFVFCESLHGAIVAQAYGIPWAWWKGRHGGKAQIKWADWFSSIQVEPASFRLYQLKRAERWAASVRPSPPSSDALIDALRSQTEVICAPV